MDIMRARNTGTFDKSTKTWRIKGQGVQVSVRQLSKRYGEDVPPTKQGSLPYWRRYLQDLEDNHRVEKKASSPLQTRIASIEGMIDRLKLEGLPTGELERLLTVAINTDPHDIEAADIPVLHPQAERLARMVPGIGDNDLAIGLLNNLIPTVTPPAKDGIRAEAEVFLTRYAEKRHKGIYQVRQAIDLFLMVTGDIGIRDVNVHHYRQYRQEVIKHPTWGERTRVNQLNTVKTFLKRVEADHGVNYNFIRNPDYNLPAPEGQKVQYTLEQVKTALANATGDIRLALLLGLNTGAYWGDIKLLTQDMLQGQHLKYVRAKLRHKTSPVMGSYLLWDETRALLTFKPLNVRKLAEQYTAFRLQHGLPEHIALRKTTAQLIQDHVGESESRLFRAEKVGGTHGRNYIVAFTEEQQRKLDNALLTVGRMYGIVK